MHATQGNTTVSIFRKYFITSFNYCCCSTSNEQKKKYIQLS
jgi:hypothetical protein